MKPQSNLTLKLLLITIISLLWVFIIPGYVAYKNNVFFGYMFMKKIPIEEIKFGVIHLNERKVNVSPSDTTLQINPSKSTPISFAGFGDQGLNYVWLESYIILLSFLFIINYDRNYKKLDIKILFQIAGTYFILQFPIWIRNFTEIGKVGRTVFSYVNYDIDKASYFLQELRILGFAILLCTFWNIYHNVLEDKLKFIERIKPKSDINSLNELCIEIRFMFFQWQRDIILVLILFLPWTWFFWRNISVHGDARYFFSGIIFHSLWIYTIISVSIPFFKLYSEYKNHHQRILHSMIQDNIREREYNYVDSIEPLPRGQLLFTSLATLISFVSPLIQTFIK